jgi:hypothetical protein
LPRTGTDWNYLEDLQKFQDVQGFEDLQNWTQKIVEECN